MGVNLVGQPTHLPFARRERNCCSETVDLHWRRRFHASLTFSTFAPPFSPSATLQLAGAVDTEASGNVTLRSVKEIASTGVTYISVGALTHSVQALDISLKIQTQ